MGPNSRVGVSKLTNKYVLSWEGVRAMKKNRVKMDVGQEMEIDLFLLAHIYLSDY